MKKFLAILLAAMMVVSLFAFGGCDSADDDTDTGYEVENEVENLDDEDEEEEEEEEEEEAVVTDVVYTAPEGFVINEEQSGSGYTVYCLEALLEGESTDGSNINFADTPTTAVGFDSYTSDVFEEQYETMLGVDLDVDGFDRVEVAGLDAIRFEVSYDLNGIDIVQVQYFIKYNSSVEIFTLTQVGDAEWVDAFDESIEDIEVIYE